MSKAAIGEGRLEIACAARVDYLPHTAAMLASATANAGMPLRVHLLVGDDVADRDLATLSSWLDDSGAELKAHRVEADRYADLTTTATLPAAHWYRAALPELLAGHNRILYLDSDVLVLDSLVELWRTELEGNLVAAVTNVFPDRSTGDAYCRALGLAREDYFNSGVMLLDLEALRATRSFQRAREFVASTRHRLILPEQDAMNAVVGGRRLTLPPRWNAMVALEQASITADSFDPVEVRRALDRPAIRHFEGSRNKPWLPDADHGARQLWHRFAATVPHLSAAV